MNKEIIVSIIIATYNSENTIWRTFKSIKEQTFDRENVEVLVIDGGSTDNTRQIARGAGAKVIDNPDRLPEKAKIIGVKNAKGKYILIMDSDETFYNKHILQKRINILENIPGIMAIQGGVLSKKKYEDRRMFSVY